MTYRSKQANASIVEVPISFVDRVVGESKMSSAIVVEAFALVTYWALGRLVRLAIRLKARTGRTESKVQTTSSRS
jgi:dolichol-phosphate mannosyltransferase